MKKKYELYNRDGIPVKLVMIEDGKYSLNVETDYEPIFNVTKGEEDNTYLSIDPSGGPFIMVGMSLLGYDNILVDKIYYDKERSNFVCVLKEKENEKQTDN